MSLIRIYDGRPSGNSTFLWNMDHLVRPRFGKTLNLWMVNRILEPTKQQENAGPSDMFHRVC
jgi:hypothetical protein